MITFRKDAATGHKYKMYKNGREVREDLWGRHFDEAISEYEGKLLSAKKVIASLKQKIANNNNQ